MADNGETTTEQPTRVRRVLHRKRAVLRDSLTVARTTWRTLRRDRFLLGVLFAIIVGGIGGLILWRVATKASAPGDRNQLRPLVIALRLMTVLCVQYMVAAWLYSRWTGEVHERGRHLWRRLLPRLPAFLFWAIVLAWLDRATRSSTFATLIRTGASFGLGYALSYAVPAAAVYRTGMFRAFHRSYQAFRRTFGADLFAWSGVWLITGVVSLLTAAPEAFDLYTPGSTEQGGFIRRVLGWAFVIPLSLGALALSAGFCTVIFFALTRNQAPSEYSKPAVETVCGLHLDDN